MKTLSYKINTVAGILGNLAVRPGGGGGGVLRVYGIRGCAASNRSLFEKNP